MNMKCIDFSGVVCIPLVTVQVQGRETNGKFRIDTAKIKMNEYLDTETGENMSGELYWVFENIV